MVLWANRAMSENSTPCESKPQAVLQHPHSVHRCGVVDAGCGATRKFWTSPSPGELTRLPGRVFECLRGLSRARDSIQAAVTEPPPQPKQA